MNVVLLVLAAVLNYSFREVQTVFAEYMWLAFAVICYAVPLAALLLRRKPRESKK